jgi:hypothetical protein
MANRNLVAPREQQPNPVAEWPGHTSAKFTTNKAHIPEPVVDQKTHPVFAMDGRRHFDEKLSGSY